MKPITQLWLGASIALLWSLAACKKQEDVTPTTGTSTSTVTTPSTTTADVRDSLYIYMKDIYLWYDKLPTVFNPRSFKTVEDEMDSLRAYQPLDRWSFVESASSFNSYMEDGQEEEFGFWIKSDANGDYRVRYVYANSPAGKAGIQRGWKLTTLNGTSVSKLSTDAIIDAFWGSNTTGAFGFQKVDGSTVSPISLTKTTYTMNTVLYTTTYEVGTKKVGYFVLNTFTGSPTQKELKQVFSQFESAGISELIVDLRYNGGGSVNTEEYLANRIVPPSASGKTMYKVYHNDKYSKFNQSVNFIKSGSLNLSRVFVITTAATASASELLINVLKPYMTVYTIGKTTHGKPVGMYGFDVMNYTFAPVAFRTVNAQNVGDYYSGLPVNADVNDGLTSVWGDTQESCLASALRYIQTGTFSMMTQGARLSAEQEQTNQYLDKPIVQNLVIKPSEAIKSIHQP
ncbi:MAG: S41 family peptidase [Spirosomataceae bacterium]